jgi:hypothetical protein
MRELTHEEKVDRLYDQHQIRNLMARYAYCGFEANAEEIVALFSKRDDAFVDCEGMGVFEGQDGLRKFFVDWHNTLNGDVRGVFSLHALTTELIEVAADGKTARGRWVSPGIESKRQTDGELEAYWIWGEYAVNFIKEGGAWKFWKFRIPHIILCDYHNSWTDLAKQGEAMGKSIAATDAKPRGKPSTFKDEFYGLDKVFGGFIRPPFPYETEDEVKDLWRTPGGR